MPGTSVTELMAELAELENPKVRAVNEKHDDDHGVNLSKLRAIAKRVKTQQPLARELWTTDGTAARLLALPICKPKEFDGGELDSMLRLSRAPKVQDWLVNYVVRKNAHVEACGWHGWTMPIRWSACATVSLVSGPHDLLVDCYVSSQEELLRTLTLSFADLPGLIHRDVSFSNTIHHGASEWRSGTLEPAQIRQLTAPVQPVRVGHVPDAVDTRLLAGLTDDGRMSWARLGSECAVSAQTAKRRVGRLLDSGSLSLRCDTAVEIGAGQREVSLLLSVPAPSVEAIGAYLGQLPGCRLSAEVLGAANLLVTLWVHDFSEVRELEVELARRSPECTVVSRQATVRHYKRAGRLLDSRGRSCGAVPVPLWDAGAAG